MINQLSLPLSHTENTLRQCLEEGTGKTVSLVLTNNSTSMLTARSRDGIRNIRLHRMFLNADSGIIDEIVAYLKNRRGPMTLFRAFVRDNSAIFNARPRQSAQRSRRKTI